MADQKLCSRCKSAPKLKSHDYCRECHNAYMRDRAKTAKARYKTTGLEAMRAELLRIFLQVGGREMTGYTAAEITRRAVVR